MHLQLPPQAHQSPPRSQSPLERLSPSHSQDYGIGALLTCTLPPCDLSSPNTQTMTRCAPCASRPSTSKSSFESRSTALLSLLSWYTQMYAAHSLLPPSAGTSISYYSLTTIPASHSYGCSLIRSRKLAPPPTRPFRPELMLWARVIKSNDSDAIMAEESTITRPSAWCSLPVVQHMNPALHTLTIRTASWRG